MIYDKLSNINSYIGLNENIVKGLKFLQTADFSKMEDGRYDIDGDNLYINISHFETRESNTKLEAHRKYADIQYVISGEEKVGFGQLEDAEKVLDSLPENDCYFYEGKVSYVTLGQNMFVIFFPQDTHAAAMYTEESQMIRKAVVKARL